MSELYTDIMRRSSKDSIPRASSLSSIDSIMTPSRMSGEDLDTSCSSTHASTEPSDYVRGLDLKVKRLSSGRSNVTAEPEVFEYVFNKACQSEGINLVLIPRGIYLLWPIVLNGPCNGLLEFVILGTLKAPTDKVFSINVDHWITFQHIDGLIITGGGKLDGQGPSAWNENNCSKDPNCKTLPISLRLNFVNNARISYLHSINSKETHVNIWGCTHMKLNHIHIIAPKDSPNTDGIRIGSSSNIEILNSIIATGDDCVAMSPGSKDIIIQNVKCGPGHGISVGSLGKLPNEEDVSGLWVTNCTFIGTQNGLRVKTWATPYSSNVFNLTFEDIIMDNVNNPIIIDQQYCPRANCQKGNSQVQIQDVKYINIRGTSSSKLAVTFDCSKSKPCENIELNDINLTYKSVGHAASSCSNAKGTTIGQQQPRSCL
nr:exopolygalacturonase [Quercus suber]